MSLQFGSKARNLINVDGKLTHAKVLPAITTSLKAFTKDTATCLAKIASLQAQTLIIRSSSSQEDSQCHSNAGAFLSIAHIPSDDTTKLSDAIRQVGESMPSIDDEILIQPMLTQLSVCGVAFSVDKDNFAPYIQISYDSSGSHDNITSGTGKEIHNVWHYRFAPMPKDWRIQKLISLLNELEILFDTLALDIEFAFAKDSYGNEQLYLLQVRPLVMQGKPNFYHHIPIRALERLHKRIDSISSKHPHVLGEKAIFGVMPDWNPAEIIGLKPKRLSLSLYKEIVTDNIWAYQRDNYGYRNLRSHPLMHSFLGIPYVDVRLSFNSFIPKNLDEKLAHKLADFYLNTLENTPQYHDKIEFKIVFSCYCVRTPHRLQALLEHGFNANEIKRIEFALLELTNHILNPHNGLYLNDLQKARTLEQCYDEITSSSMPLYDKIYWLIEDCKRFGTLPFAGIARAAFVAMQILNSLKEIGFLSAEEQSDFLSSLNTVSKELTKDTQKLPANKDSFLKKYGHLRAGSYNILSPRYDEAFDEYFSHSSTQAPLTTSPSTFSLSEAKYKELDSILRENGLQIEAKALFDFFKTVIEGRESVKFAFSKLLSKTLSLIQELGEQLGIPASDMAHADIKSILNLYSSLYQESPKERLLREIKAHKEEYELTLALKLPPLILKGEDVWGFSTQKITPNFITQKNITAEVFLLAESQHTSSALKGKIVLITSADPGYDYLFANDIAGFITCYGGANSHMAIRASELGLPAVIGVGEENFKRYATAHKIRIECESEQVICINT